MPDDSDFAADLAERERQALTARHKARLPPPSVPARGAIFAGSTPARPQDRDQEKA